jgi:hypothetical protein
VVENTDYSLFKMKIHFKIIYKVVSGSFQTVTVAIASVREDGMEVPAHTPASLLRHFATWYLAVNMLSFYISGFLTSYCNLSAMDDKMKQHVCIKFE